MMEQHSSLAEQELSFAAFKSMHPQALLEAEEDVLKLENSTFKKELLEKIENEKVYQANLEVVISELYQKADEVDEATLKAVSSSLDSFRAGESLLFLRRLSSHPSSLRTRALTELCQRLLFENSPQEVISLLEEENDPSFHLIRGEAYERLGEKLIASEEYLQFAKFQDDSRLAATAAKLARQEGKRIEDLSAFKPVPELLVEMGLIALSENQPLPQGARELEIDPESNPHLYSDWVLLRTQVLFREGNTRSAFDFLVDALKWGNYWPLVISLAYQLGIEAFEVIQPLASGENLEEVNLALSYFRNGPEKIVGKVGFKPYRLVEKMVEDEYVSEAISFLNSQEEVSPVGLAELMVRKNLLKAARQLLLEGALKTSVIEEAYALLVLSLEAQGEKLTYQEAKTLSILLEKTSTLTDAAPRVEAVRILRESNHKEFYPNINPLTS